MNPAIHPKASIGLVRLKVSNLDQSLAFYQEQLGFKLHWQNGALAGLGAGKEDLLELEMIPGARPRPRQGYSGLYHFAILTPSRKALARSILHLVQNRTPVDGGADHLVSEALYLPDPDGNGIEIYRDRPASEWPFRDGKLVMDNRPLDVDGILAELDSGEEEWTGLHSDTTIGHIHLHVADLDSSEQFYHQALGFDKMMRFGTQAAFLSAGGYHHHIGINTWAGRGAPRPPENMAGLAWFTIRLPHQLALDEAVARAESAKASPKTVETEGAAFEDPSGNKFVFTIGITTENSFDQPG